MLPWHARLWVELRGRRASSGGCSVLWGQQTGLSPLTLLGFCFLPAPGEESVLPLLTQDASSKARRGILRRAVFSEDQRKVLEKMFQKQKYISKADRKKLAATLGLKESQVWPGGEAWAAWGPQECREAAGLVCTGSRHPGCLACWPGVAEASFTTLCPGSLSSPLWGLVSVPPFQHCQSN